MDDLSKRQLEEVTIYERESMDLCRGCKRDGTQGFDEEEQK